MIPALQPGIGGGLSDEQLLLPAAALHAAAAPLDHMLGCEVTQDEASVWADAVCAHAGTAMVMRACIVTQVRRRHFNLIVANAPHLMRFSSAVTNGLCWRQSQRALARTWRRSATPPPLSAGWRAACRAPPQPSSRSNCATWLVLRQLTMMPLAGCGCWTGFRRACRQASCF